MITVILPQRHGVSEPLEDLRVSVLGKMGGV